MHSVPGGCWFCTGEQLRSPGEVEFQGDQLWGASHKEMSAILIKSHDNPGLFLREYIHGYLKIVQKVTNQGLPRLCSLCRGSRDVFHQPGAEVCVLPPLSHDKALLNLVLMKSQPTFSSWVSLLAQPQLGLCEAV